MAHPKLEAVRQRYGFRCGYCGVSEVDAGADLSVDHYRPLISGGDEADDNLVYCCFKCNQYKADYFSSEQDRLNGRRVLHPWLDELAEHLREESNGELAPLTETGRFHIALLHLNRPAIVAYRLRRRLATLLAAKARLIETENAQLRTTIAAQSAYIELLRKLLSTSGPEEE